MHVRFFAIVLGEGRMLPEFEIAISAMTEGETKTFGLTFSADYHGKEVAGKTAQFAMTAKRVLGATLPALDEAFARSIGVASGSLADLRAEISQNLELELERKVESVVKDQALAALRSNATFTPPRSLVEEEAMAMANRMAENLRQQGMKAEDIKVTPDMFVAQAADRVVLGLVLGDLVRGLFRRER